MEQEKGYIEIGERTSVQRVSPFADNCKSSWN